MKRALIFVGFALIACSCVSHAQVPLHINDKDYTCEVKQDRNDSPEYSINWCEPSGHPERQENDG